MTALGWYFAALSFGGLVFIYWLLHQWRATLDAWRAQREVWEEAYGELRAAYDRAMDSWGDCLDPDAEDTPAEEAQ